MPSGKGSYGKKKGRPPIKKKKKASKKKKKYQWIMKNEKVY